MKRRIIFSDDELNLMVYCLSVLRHNWYSKVRHLKSVGTRVEVYWHNIISIFVEYYKHDNKENAPIYRFVYQDHHIESYSCTFIITGRIFHSVIFVDSDAGHTYNYLLSIFGPKQKHLKQAEEIKEIGNCILLKEWSNYERVYDDLFDEYGHEEITDSHYELIKYVGINPHTNRREYVLKSDDKTYTTKFQIVEKSN